MRLMDDIDALDINVEKDSLQNPSDLSSHEDLSEKWDELANRYNRAIGLSFGVRSMLPVLAESFVNLLMYILMKPEIKNDARLQEKAIRQPIDIRIRSLSHNCTCFTTAIDYTHDACRNYHSLINDRNDLLHGNVVIDKLKFGDVYFLGTVPIFKQYATMWERAFGVSLKASGFDQIHKDHEVVEKLIEYLLSCIDEKIRDKIRSMALHDDLGVLHDNGRIGVLFGKTLVDSFLAPSNSGVPGT